MATIVIPNHLPHLDFLSEWSELKDHKLIVVQDVGDKPAIPEGFDITIYDHQDIAKDLGSRAWIIPTKTSACRSYGYYKAWQSGAKTIITLDTDCFPDASSIGKFVSEHERMLATKTTLGWVGSNTLYEFTRGYPYLIRNQSPVWLNHGMWSKVPDLDGATWLQDLSIELPPYNASHVIPKDNFFPVCGMNLAWNAELTPALYFGLFGPDYGFDQYDDIWAGVLVKKVLDHLNIAARSGFPSVEHRKQSNVFTNINKQAPGLAMNEHFWEVVRDIKLTKTNVTDAYLELIRKLPNVIEDEPTGYTKKFKEAATIWANLFKSSSLHIDV